MKARRIGDGFEILASTWYKVTECPKKFKLSDNELFVLFVSLWFSNLLSLPSKLSLARICCLLSLSAFNLLCVSSTCSLPHLCLALSACTLVCRRFHVIWWVWFCISYPQKSEGIPQDSNKGHSAISINNILLLVHLKKMGYRRIWSRDSAPKGINNISSFCWLHTLIEARPKRNLNVLNMQVLWSFKINTS